ncbi:MAG: YdeI/OmpD-associated family protein [Saprospiraceae bacterium]|nr:YdeI/OmpD-associated family protein [Saprospiraceae bacterium]MBK9220697.1 YdeI/OmpD-associated family protein [Saprospiraceae bacterium]MBK9722459.1 YdeI/OmpD-associated family protein [Saprospiraceae bacterium]
MELNEQGVKIPKVVKQILDHKIQVTDDFIGALEQNPIAKSAFDKFSNSHKREYIQYITEAKREETRRNRLLKSIEMLEMGKYKNDK